MNDPRPAMISARPPESRSSVAKSWNTRTGSSELSTLTALVRRIVSVLAAIAASTTAGAETIEVLTMVLADAEDVEPDLFGEDGLLDQVAHALVGADDVPVERVLLQLGEGVEPDLHRSTVPEGPVLLSRARAIPACGSGRRARP